uniref:Uncharacterized protein n=1 Tax=Tanacetum cinerariifolium TaxID=118510 RepID=A0A6L2P665_TANCI|nr:hypothetical protein [Tanacetum cinerariifolium]
MSTRIPIYKIHHPPSPCTAAGSRHHQGSSHRARHHHQLHPATTTTYNTTTAATLPSPLLSMTQPTPPPQQQWRFFQPLPPPWWATGGGLATMPRGCPPPNHHRGGGRMTVQPPQPHLVVSGCDGATPSEASGLLYDNSSPRPPKEFVFENSNVDIESFSPSPILVEDSDSFMEEIDLSFNPDDPMPPTIKNDVYDSERDILIHEELLDNYSFSLPVNESFHFDIPLFFRPPAKPPDGNTKILNIKMMGDIYEQKYSRKCEDSCQRILSFKSSFPQLQLGIMYPNLID